TAIVTNSINQSVLAAHLLLRLLRQQNRLNVGQHTTLRDGLTEHQLVQLLDVANDQLICVFSLSHVALLDNSTIAAARYSSEHSNPVERHSSIHTLRVVTTTQQLVHTNNGKL
ncbi:hypothetical protein TSMEX_007653, partial [Taenia solium]